MGVEGILTSVAGYCRRIGGMMAVGIVVAWGALLVAGPATADPGGEVARGFPSGIPGRAGEGRQVGRSIRNYLVQLGKDELLQTPPPTGAEKGDDLLLRGAPPRSPAAPPAPSVKPGSRRGDVHEKLFIESRYPSATICATCHVEQYREWSVSQHAYAQLSPIFLAMQATINARTSTTNGDFCIRCHNPVGMNLGEPISLTNLKRPATSREGITCIVCHRVNRNYGKISGRLAIVEGNLFEPVYGPTGDKELKRVLSRPDKYRVVTSAKEPGRGIHRDVKRFFALTRPGFCGTCHDVTLLNGFRLEEAFAEYKHSPAAARGVTCQDCHMGKEQGVASGYEHGPAAVVGGVPTRPRKLNDHYFAGPDYPIVHPGIFPHNAKAAQFKTMREWLQFDVKAGWGTDAFENHVPPGYRFPPAWASIDDRYDARQIINEQLRRLAAAARKRREVLRNGFKLSDIRLTRNDDGGLAFEIDVINGTDGHAVPTGFDAERLIFLKVTVRDAAGKVIYKSGDRDPNGDVRDQHSLYVHNGELPLDRDLFNLQTKFLVRLLRGGEREQVLAVNTSAGVLPFVRPDTRATTIYGRPRGSRKHKETIDPLGRRTAHYAVDGGALTGHYPYTVDVKLISQMVPVNLVAEIQHVGFDFGMSPQEVGERVVAGATVIRERSLVVGGSGGRQSSAAGP